MLLDENQIDEFNKKLKKSKFSKSKVFVISAQNHKGLNELVDAIFAELDNLPPIEQIESEDFDFDTRDTNSIKYEKINDNTYKVSGGRIIELNRRILVSDEESLLYLQRRVRKDGIISHLKTMGLKAGDTIFIGDLEFIYEE